jgi:hypothetical protein
MGQLALDIHNEAAARVPAAPVADPADLMSGPDLLAIFAKVAAAVAVLELVSRGARILRTAGVPNNTSDGENGDLAINLATADLYAKDGGTWAALFNLKGAPGKDATGQPGASAYQVAVQQGFAGTADQWLTSLGRAGADGKSAYQVAVAAGFVGSVGAWLDSLKGAPGQDADPLTIGPSAITNDNLATDIKIGSLSAAGNAYPQADRGQLTTVERFLVWIGPKITGLFDRVGALDTGFASLTNLVNGFNSRISALESKASGGGSGGGSGASLPIGGAAGQVLTKNSSTDGDASWKMVVNNRVGWLFSAKNELARDQRFFAATAITRIEKDAGISTLSYSINGGTAVNVVFTNNVFTPDANTPLTFPAGALITWAVAYNTNFIQGAFEVRGLES